MAHIAVISGNIPKGKKIKTITQFRICSQNYKNIKKHLVKRLSMSKFLSTVVKCQLPWIPLDPTGAVQKEVPIKITLQG